MNFWSKIGHSLFASDWYIGLAALATLILLIFTVLLKNRVKNNIDKWERENNKTHIGYMYGYLSVIYTLFITLISAFPLLGMFGTVTSLLSLNLSDAAAIENAKNSFFDALTSTTWGIIFAFVFKIVNAFISTSVENKIQRLNEFLKNSEIPEVIPEKEESTVSR